MTTRSRSPKKAADEKYFPIRVRVRVPEEGFGRKLVEMFSWLDAHAGRGQWGWNADNVLSRGARDATSFYLIDASLIAPFVEAFGLELAQGEANLCGEGSFIDLMHEVRFLGNDSVHATIEAEDVQRGREFIKLFLVYVFELPKKIELAGEKRSNSPAQQ